MNARALLLALMLMTLAGCRESGTRSGSARFLAEPQSLIFGGVPVGKQRIQHLKLENASRFTVQASLEVAPPFQAPGQVELRAGAEQDLDVTFAPGAQGPAEGELVVSWEGGRLSVTLSGEGLSPDACAPSKACEDVSWDPVAGTCIRSASADGVACSNACLREGTCESGSCIGTAVDCDDGDACTVDACDPVSGCAHAPRRCPTSADPCVAASCDPVAGCSETLVPDGTDCGTTDCTVARVCIAGTCVSRPAVDGMVCGEYSPCQDKGTCQSGSCIRPPPTVLTPRWSYAASNQTLFYSGPLSADGHLYAVEVGRNTRFPQQAWILAFDIPTGSLLYRRPIPQFGQTNGSALPMLLYGDVLIVGFRSEFVAGFDRHSGALLWATDFSHDLQPIWDAELDGGAPTYTHVWSAFERVPGTIDVLVNGQTDDVVAGYCCKIVGSWLVQIEPKTGSVQGWSRVGNDAITGPVADGIGAFAIEDRSGPDSDGGVSPNALRWILPDGGQLQLAGGKDQRFVPLAAYSGAVFWGQAEGRGSDFSLRSWSSDGGMRELIGHAGKPLTQFVLGPSGAFSVALGDGGVELLSIDRAGGIRATFALPTLVADPNVSEPLLTTGDGALIVVRDLRTSGGKTSLLGFSPDEGTFTCALDGGVLSPRSVGLSNGTFIAIDFSLSHFLLEAYDVGPLQLATSGWVCPGGNPQHTFRTLP